MTLQIAVGAFYIITALYLFQVSASEINSPFGEVLLSQGFQERAFGSSKSHDIGKRIVIGDDGFIYMGGTTIPRFANHRGWGTPEPGEHSQKADVFIAKLSTTGKLIWVQRSGSEHHDFLHDMKVTADGIYVCGTTHGDFGNTRNGTTDAFIMKYKLNGKKGWKRPYQFGSYFGDVCNTIDVDVQTKTIVAAGTTNGTIFGLSAPFLNQSHNFVASFQEVPGLRNGLKLIRGRQKGGHGFSSAEQIILREDKIFVLSRNWNPTGDENNRATTYVHILDKGSMTPRQMHILNTKSRNGLRGVKMAVFNSSDDIYVIGTTLSNDNRRHYHLQKLSVVRGNKTAEIMWESNVGQISNEIRLSHQLPCFAMHPPSSRIYVGCVEDGFYSNNAQPSSGILVVPFYIISMMNGTVEEKWHRTTTIPHDTREITDINIDKYGSGVYTGIWSSGSESVANVLFGSFGSPFTSSMLSRQTDTIATQSFIPKKGKQQNSGAKLALFSILGLLGIGAVIGILVITVFRISRQNEWVSLEQDSCSGKEIESAPVNGESNHFTIFREAEAKSESIRAGENAAK